MMSQGSASIDMIGQSIYSIADKQDKLDDLSQYEAEIRSFIDEETKSVEKSLIGLPSIGGFISKKKKHG